MDCIENDASNNFSFPRERFTELLPRNSGGGGDTQTHAYNNSYIVVCNRCRWNVFTEPLSSNERSDTLSRAVA
jgi:hypothetical protein